MIADILGQYAQRYETAEFIDADPSQFMHRVEGANNQEATAFVASVLSYGSRRQFLPKIQTIVDLAHSDVDAFVRHGLYADHFRRGDQRSFYRLNSYDQLHRFFAAYQQLMQQHGTLGRYIRTSGDGTALTAISLICNYFGQQHGLSGIVPKNTQSACKRVCMFLRWMVRSNSPVDLGLWADFIDRRSLIMPLDTHVVQEAKRLHLLDSQTASMATARRLTARCAAIFPDDPLLADFALFGVGVGEENG